MTPLSVAGVALMEEGLMAARTTAIHAERNMLDRYFKVTETGSTIGTEVRGGLTNFLVMSYILVVNAVILSSASKLKKVEISPRRHSDERKEANLLVGFARIDGDGIGK